MTCPARFALDFDIDAENLAKTFAKHERVRIQNFLSVPDADALRAYLSQTGDWRRVINGGDRVFETPSDQLTAMPDADRRALDEAIFRQAARGFQFRYDTVRVADSDAGRQLAGTPLAGFAQFMSSAPMLEFFRTLTGREDIMFADAQATRYRPGDFLTRHDDRVGGKHRTHAYVLGLSPDWLPEWGGLLLFNGQGGEIVEALTPGFNSLDLFAIGAPHSVSYVAPYAAADRISVTGWLRTALPDETSGAEGS